MRRISLAALLVSLAALLLLIPATAAPSSGAKLRGTVAAKFPDNGLIRVDSRRTASILRVPGSQARIQTGQRVELRGATLRQRGHGSRVLARNVTVVRSVALRTTSPTSGGSLAPTDDDELEVKGTLTSLSPLTVAFGSKTATCAVPSGMSLAGFAVGDFVEVTCDLEAGIWTLRKLEHEDDDDGVRGDDDDQNDDHSGPGHGDDDDDDDDNNSGHGNGDDDDDDNSGHGGGDDDDDHSED